MKTVMKKMFCLLLVAVMLVSAVPAAFAAEGAPATIPCSKCGKTANLITENAVPATCDKVQRDIYQCSDTGCPYNGNFYNDIAGSELGHDWKAATCELPKTCSRCGATEGEKLGHAYTKTSTTATCTEDGVDTFVCGNDSKHTYTQPATKTGHNYDGGVITKEPTCSTTGIKTFTCANNSSHTYTEEVAIKSDAHDYSSKGVCNYCKLCKHCSMPDAHKTNCIYYCNGTTSCPNDPAAANAHNDGCLKTKCNKNGCTLAYGHEGECSVTCTKTAGCVLKQGHEEPCDTPCAIVGCTLGYGHTGDHSNVCATCLKPKMKSPEHNANCSYYYLNAEPSNTGNGLVRVHVRLHNGTTLIDTVELLTYRDDKGTQIGDSVSAHKSMILAELAEEYPEYSWGGNLYDDPGDSQDYNEKIGTGTTVYINAYAGQDMVLVYVHNGRTFSNLRIIQLEGKRRGDTVTKKEVTAAVSKYFNVSSLSMYSEDAWEDYVDGENVESVSSLKIPADDSYYVIDVKISGTAKGGTSGTGYSADSSNPKTGDDIFAPVMVLGLSASALAVLFYLNKKRAY